MVLTKDFKQDLIREFGADEKDSGNSDVQIAILSKRIVYLTEHVKNNPKDHHTRYGLLKLVGKRRALLDYLIKTDIDRYRALIRKLKIRK